MVDPVTALLVTALVVLVGGGDVLAQARHILALAADAEHNRNGC